MRFPLRDTCPQTAQPCLLYGRRVLALEPRAPSPAAPAPPPRAAAQHRAWQPAPSLLSLIPRNALAVCGSEAARAEGQALARDRRPEALQPNRCWGRANKHRAVGSPRTGPIAAAPAARLLKNRGCQGGQFMPLAVHYAACSLGTEWIPFCRCSPGSHGVAAGSLCAA